MNAILYLHFSDDILQQKTKHRLKSNMLQQENNWIKSVKIIVV